LTPEEEEKRRQRREKNKLAASKCRNKKREQINNTKQEYDRVNQSNNIMEREIARLKAEKNQLQQSLASHQCALSGSSSSYNRAGAAMSNNRGPNMSNNRGPNMSNNRGGLSGWNNTTADEYRKTKRLRIEEADLRINLRFNF